MQTKEELRKHILELRNEIKEPQYQLRSASICVQIQNFLDDLEFESLHAFLPFRNEVDILPLLQRLHKNSKRIITTIIQEDKQLLHVEFDPNATLASGKMGIPIPMLYKPFEENPDVILVPGLVFDLDGHRIGYGGGYYDRFLVNQSKATKIGVCFEEQIEMEIPHEEHDQKVDIVISD